MNRYRRTAGKRGPAKKRLLIVTEGEKTEPQYFNGFRISSAQVAIHGTGYNTDSLVDWAIKLKDRAKKDREAFDQTWCVFDRDSFPPQNFNRALTLAQRNNIKVAYSNEAFELWYLLHFNYLDTGLSRDQYKEKLSACLGRPYLKNDPTMYETLLDKQTAAIRNSEKLAATYTPLNPCNDNPSTSVYNLVRELNKYL